MKNILEQACRKRKTREKEAGTQGATIPAAIVGIRNSLSANPVRELVARVLRLFKKELQATATALDLQMRLRRAFQKLLVSRHGERPEFGYLKVRRRRDDEDDTENPGLDTALNCAWAAPKFF